jgi:membrane protease YdiL (CAAX protease family)
MKQPSRERPRPDSSLGTYFRVTRGPWYGFLFALPVLLTYEALQLLLPGDVINGADAILTRTLMPFLAAMGQSRDHLLLVLILVGGFWCWNAHRVRFRDGGGTLKPGYFGMMLVESVIYAFFFGYAVNQIIAALMPGLLQLQIPGAGNASPSPLFKLFMALGAGIYEELLFRVIVMGGLAMLLIKGFRTGSVLGWSIAALFSSFVFSLIHYVGPYGDPFSLQSFTFRFIAGALLAALYGLRGFGVAVWTHALYDVLVMFLGGG